MTEEVKSPIKSYKGFDENLKCRDFQYEVGNSYEQDGVIKMCENGFHACEYPLDVLGYYEPSNSRYCEVEQSGEIDRRSDDNKVASSKIHISAEIGIDGLVGNAVKFIFDRVDWKGGQSAATNTGFQSAATNIGDRSAATNTGNYSIATNTGFQSTATNTGDYSAATNTGNYSIATNTGFQSTATNTGDYSAATNTGDYSAATNTGFQSAATNTGDRSAATNTGNYSAAEVGGKESIAIVTGKDGKAKGALGCWLVLTERDKDWHILGVKSVKVDGERIKADMWYKLIGGEFKEVAE